MLVAGAVLAVVGSAAGIGVVARGREAGPTGPLPELPTLPLQRDVAGVLHGSITAAPLADGLAYEGSVPGPVLRLHEGDRVRLTFSNQTPEHSSLHLHGLPLPPAVDAPLRHVMPGEADEREFTVPAGAAGTSWFHPHAHGDVERQLLAGLAGAVVVTGPADERPGLGDVDDRLVMLTRHGDEILANGVAHPLATATAARMRLRLVNATAADMLRLAAVDEAGDAMQVHVVATDAGLLERAQPAHEVLLPPGGRAEVLLSTSTPGRARLRALPYSPNADGSGARPGRTLLSLEAAPGMTEVGLPGELGDVQVLEPAEAAHSRRVVLDGDGSTGFTIDGRTFDPDRTDLVAQLGTLEIWEVENRHTVDHPFHLHSYRVQVLDRDGVPEPYRAWYDTVHVRAGETVRLAVPFVGGPGRTVYHCHIASHEDLGMMGVLEVVGPPT